MEKYLPFYLKFDEISREKNGPIRWRKSVQVGPKIFSIALFITRTSSASLLSSMIHNMLDHQYLQTKITC